MMCLGFFFFKQKTAYEMRISDWSSDVCSSDLFRKAEGFRHDRTKDPDQCGRGIDIEEPSPEFQQDFVQFLPGKIVVGKSCNGGVRALRHESGEQALLAAEFAVDVPLRARSEEHTSELQSLMRTSYADFRLKK